MSINFSNPVTSEDRAAVLADIRAHVTALAKMLDGETVSNTPTGAIRYSSSNDQFEIWGGASWTELPLQFLNRSGGTMTGGLSGTTAAFSGAITQGGNQVWHAGNFDPATKLGVSATAVRSQAVVTADPAVGQGGVYVTATEMYFRDGTANRKVWHENNFNPATKQDAASAWNTGNFDPNAKQNALGYTPVNKAGDSGLGAMTGASFTASGAVTSSEWFRTNGAQGWYNNTYGGGWYMEDTTFIRAYGNKAVMASYFRSSSMRSMKKKIKPVARGALKRVLDWKVYDFEYKDHPKLPQTGMMAEEAGKRISDGEGINLQSALFELAAAFQEYVRKHP